MLHGGRGHSRCWLGCLERLLGSRLYPRVVVPRLCGILPMPDRLTTTWGTSWTGARVIAWIIRAFVARSRGIVAGQARVADERASFNPPLVGSSPTRRRFTATRQAASARPRIISGVPPVGGRLATTRDVPGRLALVLSCSNRVLTLRRILQCTTGSPLTWRRARPVEEPPMAPYPNAAHSGDRCRHCLPLSASAQSDRKCSRTVQISWRHSTNRSPIRAIGRRPGTRPHDFTRTLASGAPASDFDAKGARR